MGDCRQALAVQAAMVSLPIPPGSELLTNASAKDGTAHTYAFRAYHTDTPFHLVVAWFHDHLMPQGWAADPFRLGDTTATFRSGHFVLQVIIRDPDGYRLHLDWYAG